LQQAAVFILLVTLIEMELICQIKKVIYEIQKRADAKLKVEHQFASDMKSKLALIYV
jgi:hypothetical protein